MTMSVPPPQAPRELGEPAELAPEASLFARIEDLIDEEHALLLIPATERGRRDHERLHEIEDQLDRIWETLRERSRRLGQRTAGTAGGSRTSSSPRARSSETGSE